MKIQVWVWARPTCIRCFSGNLLVVNSKRKDNEPGLIYVRTRLSSDLLKSDGWRPSIHTKAAWWSEAPEPVRAHSMSLLQKLTGKQHTGAFCTHVVRKDWSWLLRRTRRRWGGGCQGSRGTEMTNRKTALLSACCHQGQREGAARESQLGGILAHAHRGTLSWPHPAWNLLFSRILSDPLPPLPPSSSPLHSAHQQTPNKHASRKQTPAQPARSPPPPPPGSQEAQRRHFTRTDDAAKTTIMIINLLNLEDYAVN